MAWSELLLLLVALAASLLSANAEAGSRSLDGFEQPADWTVVASNQVTGSLRATPGSVGQALCLDYDFHGVSGYVGIQRQLPMQYPADYAFSFQLRGDSPANDLQFKLVDASGDNVWWVNRPHYDFPRQWTPVLLKKRQISRAWGPAPDPVLRRSQKLEFTLASGVGGKGSVCLDELRFEGRIPDDGSPLRVVATAPAGPTAQTPGQGPVLAVDGRTDTAWRVALAGSNTPALTLDLGRVREFGGLGLQWAAAFASDYVIELSNDGQHWRPGRRVHDGNGGRDWIALPETEARYIRLAISASPKPTVALAEVTVEPLAFAASSNAFLQAVAKAVPRGRYPRGFSGEQPYWTIVGIDGGEQQGLVGEDGAVELARGGFSIEPFVVTGDKLVSWADVHSEQSLQDGYLPIPSVAWKHPEFQLAISVFAQGVRRQSQLITRYRLSNHSRQARDYVLVLALRPLQVNPPSQFLNTTGGVSPIGKLQLDRSQARVDGRLRLRLLTPAQSVLASAFDAGDVVERLAGAPSAARTADKDSARAEDDTGLASAAWRFPVHLAAGESREFSWIALLTGALPQALPDPATAQAAVAASWRDKLNQVRWQVPAQGQRLVDNLRTAVANMLISRQGPRLQPGTRSYARAWIRDGAMISEALLRMGRADVASQFLRWYAPYQFENGKVPCCVDDRGSDPVPENDSQGELLFTVAEVYRYTRDQALLEELWPRVQGAVRYMDTLRLSERTEANRALDPAFYGLMPASISHEGYSAKAMHSYWDDFWSLRGYRDAVAIARWLGHDAEAEKFAASSRQFDVDLRASLLAATAGHGIDYLPGAAELGDFDATSSTIALSPGGAPEGLPATLVQNTFERYWREFISRRDGSRPWKDYTPYELRTIGSFVRLGWRQRAHEALAYFLADQQPTGWNQWAEVVSRTPRTPFFLGDLPHAWVASDYVRSTLDLFAYSRDADQALVIAAGIPAAWLDGEGIAVTGLRTPYGELGYRLNRARGQVRLQLLPGLVPPSGGVVLQLPAALSGGKARINGKPAAWQGAELRIGVLPAEVLIEVR